MNPSSSTICVDLSVADLIDSSCCRTVREAWLIRSVCGSGKWVSRWAWRSSLAVIICAVRALVGGEWGFVS